MFMLVLPFPPAPPPPTFAPPSPDTSYPNSLDALAKHATLRMSRARLMLAKIIMYVCRRRN